MALPAGRPCGQPDCRTGVIPTPVKPARLPWRGAPVLIALALGGLLWLGVVAGLIALVLGAFLWRGASPPPAASPLAEAETTLPADDGSAPTEAAAEAPRPQVAAPVAAAPVPAPPVPPPQLFVIGPPPKAPAVVSRPPEAAKPAAPATPSFKRRGNASEEDLRKQLEVAIDVGLDLDGPAVVRSYAASIKANLAATGAPNLIDPSPLLKVRPDLGTLPLRGGHGVKLSPKAGGHLQVLAAKLHAHLDRVAPLGPDGRRTAPAALREALRAEKRGQRPEWLRAEAVPALMQILMPEDTPVRELLVELLAEIPGPEATTALARRAVFDLSPEVRQRAVEALKGRPAAAYRSVFLQALRYPWAPPADHAAEALVALGDREAVSTLVTLLKLPDPAGPQPLPSKSLIVREVVCVKHLRNCVLCHAPALSNSDPNLGEDPFLRAPRGGGGGGAARNANAAAQSRGSSPLKVRSDIAFLRQDFSVQQPVALPPALAVNAPPQRQRFDYVVRTRRLSRKEADKLQGLFAGRTTWPQREAVLFALRELTGKDAGPTTVAWQQLYPRAEIDVEAARLGDALVQANPLKREQLLARYRVAPGPAYTQALAVAIAALTGAAQGQVREGLVQRLTRLSTTELREQFRDDNPEVRRAAVLACARKADRQFVPDLVALLDHPDAQSARLAEEGLRGLTGERHGGAEAWQAWWRKQEGQTAGSPGGPGPAGRADE
ncbi:MAG TPA: HEAT repeat domain-containing protein [Gemmataceae bacterium]|nr:HEAT repeat domain-containing protein [Gemmataceae bacterium]